MTKELAKVSGSSTLVAIDFDNLNVDAAMGALDRLSKKTGVGGSGAKRLFPGKQFSFKQQEGYLFDKAAIDAPRLVVNSPHMAACYMKWAESDSGKPYPVFSQLAIIAAGQDLVDRDSLGDLDEDEWEIYQGRKVDPWQLQAVIPVRIEGENEYHHIVGANKSNQNALFGVFKEAMGEAKLKPGMLPVVQFTEKVLERKVESTTRKGKFEVQKWKAMDYEIVDWVKAESFDRLNQNVDLGEDEPDIKVGEVKAVTRSAPPAIEHKAASKADAKAKKKVRDL